MTTLFAESGAGAAGTLVGKKPSFNFPPLQDIGTVAWAELASPLVTMNRDGSGNLVSSVAGSRAGNAVGNSGTAYGVPYTLTGSFIFRTRDTAFASGETAEATVQILDLPGTTPLKQIYVTVTGGFGLPWTISLTINNGTTGASASTTYSMLLGTDYRISFSVGATTSSITLYQSPFPSVLATASTTLTMPTSTATNGYNYIFMFQKNIAGMNSLVLDGTRTWAPPQNLGVYEAGSSVNIYGLYTGTSHVLVGETAQSSASNALRPLASYGSQGVRGRGVGAFQPLKSSGIGSGVSSIYYIEMLIEAVISAPLDAGNFVIAVMNSSGTVTGLLAVQVLIDSLLKSSGVVSGAVTPQLTVQAVMTALANASNLVFDEGSPTVWALNTKNAGTTRYNNFAFNSFAKINGSYYGVKKDGIYKLTGANDAGSAIAAAVNFGKTDFGTSRLKSLTQCYVGVASTGAVVLKVIADGQTYIYTARDSSTALGTQRVDLGRGFRANYFDLELQNSNGGAFDLASIEFTPIPLSRRI